MHRLDTCILVDPLEWPKVAMNCLEFECELFDNTEWMITKSLRRKKTELPISTIVVSVCSVSSGGYEKY